MTKRLPDEGVQNKTANNIAYVLLGLCVMLVGIRCIRFFIGGVWASALFVMPMLIALGMIARGIRLSDYIGKNTVRFAMLAFAAIALLGILFSSLTTFSEYLAGESANVSAHPEHSLSYERMTTLAQMLKEGKNVFTQISDGMRLNQYFYLYTYSSSVFIFGGLSVTNICIWSTFHLAVRAMLAVLVADKMHVTGEKMKRRIFWLVLAMPYFLCNFAYNRDIVASAVSMIAIYIYVSTYRSPFKNLLAFPIYAALLYSARYQYLIIAILMLIYALLRRRDEYDESRGRVLSRPVRLTIVFGILAFSAVILMRRGFGSFLMEDLNVDNYTQGDYSAGGIVQRIARCLVGYFPWTNIFNDVNWTYSIFMYVQAWVNTALLVLFFMQVFRHKRPISYFFSNALLVLFALFYAFGLFGAMHASYLAFGMAFLVIALEEKFSRYFPLVFGAISTSLVLLGIVYTVLGLQGSGLLNVAA